MQLKKRLGLVVLLAGLVMSTTGCHYILWEYGSGDVGDPPTHYVACGVSGVEAGQDDPDVDTYGEVGFLTTATVRIGNCNGTATPAWNRAQVYGWMGWFENGVFYTEFCGYDSDTVGTMTGDPVSATAGFRLGVLPGDSCRWANYHFDVWYSNYAVVESYIGGTLVDYYNLFSGWEKFNP